MNRSPRASKTKDALPSPTFALMRLGLLALVGVGALYLLASALTDGGSAAGAARRLVGGGGSKASHKREREAAAAVAAAAAEAYTQYTGHAHAEDSEEEEGAAGGSAAAAAAACALPPSTALAKAFATERFTLEKIVQRPGEDEWRLCYPGAGHTAGAPNPRCPTSTFFVVNQRDASSDGVVDWLQGAEEHVMDLFSAVLSTTLGDTCALRPKEKACFVTGGAWEREGKMGERAREADDGVEAAERAAPCSARARTPPPPPSSSTPAIHASPRARLLLPRLLPRVAAGQAHVPRHWQQPRLFYDVCCGRCALDHCLRV